MEKRERGRKGRGGKGEEKGGEGEKRGGGEEKKEKKKGRKKKRKATVSPWDLSPKLRKRDKTLNLGDN